MKDPHAAPAAIEQMTPHTAPSKAAQQRIVIAGCQEQAEKAERTDGARKTLTYL